MPRLSIADPQILSVDGVKAARAAALTYVSDVEPGITRQPHRSGFAYRSPRGRLIRDETTLNRIRALAIPPAWRDVWICASPDGHIQATGRDARGRKQYRYHSHWRNVRDEAKYSRMASFGSVLPKIRARVRNDLRRPRLPREKVLAALVRLMDATHLRVGNEEYARQNGSFGLTTLRDHHVNTRGHKIRFCFRGKGGKVRELELNDPLLAKIVRRCRELPGQNLFQYLDDDGVRRTVGSADVNQYLREISGQDFTAKDFRTWAGTLCAAKCLRLVAPPQTKRELKMRTSEIVRSVAERLGNTEAVCRKCYIHPSVLDAVADKKRLKLFSGASTGNRGSVASWERFLVRYIKTCERRRAG